MGNREGGVELVNEEKVEWVLSRTVVDSRTVREDWCCGVTLLSGLRQPHVMIR
jgi:hypothetical protein